jgi:hypothetical protein
MNDVRITRSGSVYTRDEDDNVDGIFIGTIKHDRSSIIPWRAYCSACDQGFQTVLRRDGVTELEKHFYPEHL